jgi:hypothetical protein
MARIVALKGGALQRGGIVLLAAIVLLLLAGSARAGTT